MRASPIAIGKCTPIHRPKKGPDQKAEPDGRDPKDDPFSMWRAVEVEVETGRETRWAASVKEATP